MRIINAQELQNQWVTGVNGFGLFECGRFNGHKKLGFQKFYIKISDKTIKSSVFAKTAKTFFSAATANSFPVKTAKSSFFAKTAKSIFSSKPQN